MFFQGQKGLLLFLFLIVSPAALPQYKIREIRSPQDTDLVFPFFYNINKAASKKINEFLQKNFFETTIYQTPELKLFDESRFFQNDSNSQSGYTSITYKVKLNNSKVLSVAFEVESMGAYPTYYQRYFSFSAKTGNILSPDSLFGKDQVDFLQKYLIAKRKAEIKKWIDELRNDGGSVFKEDSSFIFETFNDCNAEADLKNLFITSDKVLFYKEDCFPHAWMPLNTNLDIEFMYKDLERYLSVFGKKLLLTK